ncbi:MAG: hypothetical protein HRS57_02200 [Mycoplasmataceae bacterium]|nr:hypothetical protein [Mycoplasmataceae bacterium]
MSEDLLREDKETSIVKRSFICSGFYLLTSTDSIYISDDSNVSRKDTYDSNDQSFFDLKMLDKLRRTFERKYSGNIVDSIIMERHNDEIIAIFMNKTGKYFVHNYENNSSYKEVNLINIAKDIIERWGVGNKDMFWWEVVREDDNKETLKGAAMIQLKEFDEYNTVKNQPITTLMSWLLHSNELAKEFTIMKNIRVDEDKESNNEKSMLEQINYFKRNPNLLRYSHLQGKLVFNKNESNWESFENLESFLEYKNSLYKV